MIHARAPHRATALALVLALSACTAVLGPTGPRDETSLGGQKGRGKVGVQIAGSRVTITAVDGSSTAGMVLVVGGRVLRPDAKGLLTIPADLLAAAKAGGILVLGPGLAPRRLDPASGTVVLAPAASLAGGFAGAAPIMGGGLTLSLGTGAVAPNTPVSISMYTPEASAGWEAKAEADRAALSPAGCGAPLPCPPPVARLGVLVAIDGELRPGPLTLTLDLAGWLRGWDGRAPAPWEASPAGWSDEDRSRATAAARILETFAAIDAAGDPTLRERLASAHGLSLLDRQLSIVVPVTAENVATGLVRTDVWGSLLLGVGLEVTVLSAVRDELPGGLSAAVGAAAGTPPSTIVSGGAGGLISTPNPLPTTGLPAGDGLTSKVKLGDSLRGHGPAAWLALGGGAVLARAGAEPAEAGAKLLSDYGAGLISNNGGGLLSDVGGGLLGDVGGAFGPPLPGQISGLAPNAGRIEGVVEGPFSAAKYRLAAQFPFVSYAGVEVTLPYVEGAPTATSDVTGRFVLTDIPATGPHVLVGASHDGQTLLSICPAPRAAGQARRADLNPDTTAAAAATLFWLGRGCAVTPEFDPAGYQAALTRVAGSLTLDAYYQLQAKLYQPVSGVGSFVEDRLGTTFINVRTSFSALNPGWVTLANVRAGQRVGFDASGTTYNGSFTVGPLSDPAYGDYGQIRVRAPGMAERVIPLGQNIEMTGNGPLEARYYDELDQFDDNAGAYDLRLWVSGCP